MKKGTIYPLPLINFFPQTSWSLLSETETQLSLYMMKIQNNSNVPVMISFDSTEGHAECLPYAELELKFPVGIPDPSGLMFSRLYAKSTSDVEVVGRCTIMSFIFCRGS